MKTLIAADGRLYFTAGGKVYAFALEEPRNPAGLPYVRLRAGFMRKVRLNDWLRKEENP